MNFNHSGQRVFDVQQTSGEPLPTLVTMKKVEGYEQLKEALILISPVQFSESIEDLQMVIIVRQKKKLKI